MPGLSNSTLAGELRYVTLVIYCLTDVVNGFSLRPAAPSRRRAAPASARRSDMRRFLISLVFALSAIAMTAMTVAADSWPSGH